MPAHNQFSLLAQRRFLPYFTVQSLGAFNDNLYRQAVIGLLVYLAVEPGTLTLYAMLAPAVFILPYLLFGAVAGQIAEKLEKHLLVRITTRMEVAIMMLAAAGFLLQNLPVLLVALFATGVQSTLFGPVKYSILPEVLKPEELTGGNGLVETGTAVSILAGMICGGLIFELAGAAGTWVAATAVVLLALAGNRVARMIPRVDAGQPDLPLRWNPLRESWRIWQISRRDTAVRNAVLGVSWFWFFGTLLTAQLPAYATSHLGGGHSLYIFALALFSIGVAAGSLLCERLSGRIIEIGLVPLGAFGMSAFLLDLNFASPGSARVVIDLAGIGVFAGLYVVPLLALIQSRTPRAELARVIAGMNIQNALFIVATAGVGLVATRWLGWSVPQLFLALAVANLVVALCIFSIVPEFLLRLLGWVLVRALYRLRPRGIEEHVPDEGPALLVCNHVSYMDALLLGASVPRPVRFVMHYRIFELPVLRWVFRTAKTIPIAGAREDPQLLQRALDEIDAALADGELVCIFPEGGLTRDGQIAAFRPGVERILARRPVPVVPLALRGMWASMWSRRRGGSANGFLQRLRLPQRMRARVEVVAGEPVDGICATAAGLEARVRALRGIVA